MKKKPSLTQSVVRNAFFQGLSGIIAKFGGLIFAVVVARFLSPGPFGVYSLALSVILILSAISDFGIGAAVTRYIAESLGKKKKEEARSRFLFLFKFKLMSALVFSAILFLSSTQIANLLKKPELVLPLQVGAIYLFLNALYGIVGPIFLSLQKVKYSTLTESIFQASRVGLIFVFLYYHKSVAAVFNILSISVALSLLTAFIIIRKKYSFLISGKKEKAEKRRLLTFSAFAALGTIGLIIFGSVDKLMLGYFLEAKFVGFYNAILTLVTGVLGLVGFTGVVFPAFTQLQGKRLKKAFKKTVRVVAIFAIPAAIGLAYVALPAIKILYSQAYVPVQYRFALLFTSIFLSLLVLEGIFSGLYQTLFAAKEKPKIPAIVSIIASVLNVILNFLLISFFIKIKPEYGLIGAASATFVSRYVYFIALAFLSSSKLRIVPDKSSFLKPLSASLAMLAFLFAFDHFISLNLFYGIIMIFLAALVYFGTLWLIKGINKEDFKLLEHLTIS